MRFLTHHRANLYGLKIRFPPGSVGSSPTSDTTSQRGLRTTTLQAISKVDASQCQITAVHPRLLVSIKAIKDKS